MSEAASLRDAPGPSPDPCMRLVRADCTTRAMTGDDVQRWNDFVRAHPDGTFFHLAEWAQVLREAFGHTVHYLCAERGGQLVGVLPLAEVKSLLFGHALVSTPFCVYGGVLALDDGARNALERSACDLGGRLGVSHIELRNRTAGNPDWPTKQLYVTFRREISAEAEPNMLAIPRKQRAMVRKGLQNRLGVEIDADTKRLYAIYSESLRNLGTPVFSRRYPELLKKIFGDQCEVLTVVNGREAVASVLSFYFRDEVLPYYGGSRWAARSVAANDFMYWQVMERARERGMRRFDFGRSKLGSGSFDFKAHWGFTPEKLCYQYSLVRAREIPDLSPSNAKYRQLIRIWQRLPLAATRLIGPPLARHLG